MTDFSALVSVQPALLQKPPTAPGAAQPQITAADTAKRGQIKETAQKFEGQFLSMMMQQMFEGLDTSGPFSGGPGAAMFRSFLTDAMAQQMTQRGGIGIADVVNREMLKLQGMN